MYLRTFVDTKQVGVECEFFSTCGYTFGEQWIHIAGGKPIFLSQYITAKFSYVQICSKL